MRKRRRLFRRIRAVVLVILLSTVIVAVFKGMTTADADIDLPPEDNSNLETPVIDAEPILPDKFVLIDPGHGGIDGGAIGFSGSHEKDINLEISKKLKKELEDIGYKALLTRENDEFMDYTSRTEIANREMPDVFLSIHGNSIENYSDANGVQVYHFPNKENQFDGPTDEELAKIILDGILEETGAKDMGTIEGRLMVLRNAKMPAVLIEYGFLSNESEEKLLLTDEYQDKVVAGIVRGLEDYFSLKLDE